jgi:hypothetical protein
VRTLLRVILVSAGCLGAYATYGDDGQLLSTLQSELHRVRTSTSDKPTQITPVPDVGALVGMNIGQISQALGKPDARSPKSLRYSFYHLPVTYVGGGPELFIIFDRNGTVTMAEWRGSQ